MKDYECEKCHDTGYLTVIRDGMEFAERCECYEKLVTKRYIKLSGISEQFLKKGFKEFDDRGMVPLIAAKKQAQRYYQKFLENRNSRQNSIIFCGQAGSGKTHLGLAVCNNLMNVCHVSIAYMAYRNAITEVKQCVTDKENYYRSINRYCNASVLYIDDLLKGKVTEADLNILYEIINYRYMKNIPMIISTEKMPDELLEFDEAIGSRILEMCRGNIITLVGKELNYRLIGIH